MGGTQVNCRIHKKLSRLPCLTTKHGLPTPPPSPDLLHQELANSIAGRPSVASVKCLTIEDLYRMFRGKPRPSSLAATQTRLQPALSSSQRLHPIRLRQTSITTYFKSASNSHGPKTKLVFNRKHADLKKPGKSTRNGDLETNNHAEHSTHICHRCAQRFVSRNMIHRQHGHNIIDTK